MLSIVVRWTAAYVGDLTRKLRPVAQEGRTDFDMVLTATLTLLALIIGFSFSMAVSRYDQRVRQYRVRGVENTGLDDESLKLQGQLWSSVVAGATGQPTPVLALAVSGMNDVLDSQGFTRAAWLNRIPPAVWALLASIAVSANLLLGYRERRTDLFVLMVLPLTVSIALFLISDIDSPHGGVIRVVPHNLVSLSEVINAR